MAFQEPPSLISDYGLIGNCRTAALVSNRGSIDWCCLPYFDSDSYFSALLDHSSGGSFSIQPEIDFNSHQRYLTDTNVLETTFETSSGKATLLDCFSVTTERERSRMSFPSNEILRKLEVVDGEIPFLLHCSPKPHYNAHPHFPSDQRRLGLNWTCGHDELRLVSELDPEAFFWREGRGGPEALSRFVLRRGERLFFSLSYHQLSPAIVPALQDQAELRLESTLRFWKDWTSQSRYSGPYTDAVRRSALALKLLTFAPSGAIVAAPTSSLPETPGVERNWDYRYGWMRDSAFTVRALLRLGYRTEATAYLNWMLDTGAGVRGRFQIMYSLFGARVPPEQTLGWYSGYRRSQPVRVGNAARDQFQLDIYGEVLGSVLSFAQEGTVLDGETRRLLVSLGRQVCDNWQKPDYGIWEPRGEPLHHTHSKVMAWVALDRLVSFCGARKIHGLPVDEYASTRARIREAIESRGFDHQARSYTGVFGSPAMDAALLTLPLVGYCSPFSGRMQGTIKRVRSELGRGDLVYRYRALDDGLSGSEGCFGVCSFWLVDALARSGHRAEAQTLFERFLARSNPVGLWPEEIDPASGEFLGSYPQAFTHIGLINSALTLQETRRETAA